jgi:3-methylfumaryl-CoA hydratase
MPEGQAPDTGTAPDATGRTRTETGCLTPVIANMLGAALLPGWQPAMLPPGAVLPPLWHWAAFHPDAPMANIGPDGHPRPGDFLPELGLPRRMWAGGSLDFHKPLHVGEDLTRTSRIVAVDRKQAATGPMALVTVTHAIHGQDGLAIEEVQNIVYLEQPQEWRPPRREPVPADAPAFQQTVAIDPVLLFRYSAATYNGHRIHYDRDYATGVEHYPGLVVHGPLQATLLADALQRHRGAPMATFRYRGVHPMLDTHDLHLLGWDDPGTGMTACTAAPGGWQGTRATATWGAA